MNRGSMRMVWIGAFVVASVATVGILLQGRPRPQVQARQTSSVNQATPVGLLADALARGDHAAMVELERRLLPTTQPSVQPIPDTEWNDWNTLINGLRTGFLKHNAIGRTLSVDAIAAILNRIGTDPAPVGWTEILTPSREILSVALNDRDLNVRVAGLRAVTKCWDWLPAASLTLEDREKLASWKEQFHPVVVRRLADQEPGSRIAAIICLAALPLDEAASPAVAYIRDPDPRVRAQVLIGFAARRAVLSEDEILPILYDPALGSIAQQVLRARGLAPELIDLGRKVFSPDADVRISVIDELTRRSEIDPVVWLVHLSRDQQETVRAKAVDALGAYSSPEARARLEELTQHDPSAAIRESASKLTAQGNRTVALPPLPGSIGTYPKAN
jgi:hypothetical protein